MMKLKTVKDENVKGNIELFGNRRVIVEGCKGVIGFFKAGFGEYRFKDSW